MLQCGRFRLPLERPLVMGVINVTPDSFSDGGAHFGRDAAIAHAHRLVDEGADLLDLGGESTRPGARAVSISEELARVLPVLEAIRGLPVPVSVDTRRTRVMEAALAAGASMINDVDALAAPGAIDALAPGDCAICLMHKKGDPATMQDEPHYEDVLAEVRGYLLARAAAAEQAGIARARIVIDPGFGFGKTDDHNFRLLKNMHAFTGLGYAVLAGWSRKSTLGRLTGRPVGERLAASLAAALLAADGGANILRVHDVRETREALLVREAWRKA